MLFVTLAMVPLVFLLRTTARPAPVEAVIE
jgi:hypothetical protein